MAKQKKKTAREQSEFITKITTIVIGTLILLFLMGHLSMVLNQAGEGLGFMEAVSLVPEHIKTEPLGFLAVNPYVAYFGGLGYLLFFVISLSKQTMPKADMKGIEHGSSDFQSSDDRIDFLSENTTEILELDTSIVEEWAKKRREELGIKDKKEEKQEGGAA